MFGCKVHFAGRSLVAGRDFHVAIIRLHVKVTRDIFQVNVFRTGDNAARARQFISADLVAGYVEIARDGSKLHVGAGRLEDDRLRNLAEADVFVEVAIQANCTGDLFNGCAVDSSAGVDVAGNLGNAYRAFLQIDLHWAGDFGQSDISV